MTKEKPDDLAAWLESIIQRIKDGELPQVQA